MHENNGGRVTFLVNLMLRRLDKFDELIFVGGELIYGGGAYIRYFNFNWVTYLGGIFSDGEGVLTRFYGIETRKIFGFIRKIS